MEMILRPSVSASLPLLEHDGSSRTLARLGRNHMLIRGEESARAQVRAESRRVGATANVIRRRIFFHQGRLWGCVV